MPKLKLWDYLMLMNMVFSVILGVVLFYRAVSLGLPLPVYLLGAGLMGLAGWRFYLLYKVLKGNRG